MPECFPQPKNLAFFKAHITYIAYFSYLLEPVIIIALITSRLERGDSSGNLFISNIMDSSCGMISSMPKYLASSYTPTQNL